jgi:hypothetical protein
VVKESKLRRYERKRVVEETVMVTVRAMTEMKLSRQRKMGEYEDFITFFDNKQRPVKEWITYLRLMKIALTRL